jgi:transposase-like protein
MGGRLGGSSTIGARRMSPEMFEKWRERRARALAMRQEGRAYAEIAKEIGVSTTRVGELIRQALRYEGFGARDAHYERKRLLALSRKASPRSS